MPPKQKYTREIILNKSYEIFASQGMDAVNARSVSAELGCSTQPIFSYFPDMESLRRSLSQKAVNDFMSAVADAETQELSLESICTAYVLFAARNRFVFLHMTQLADEMIVHPFDVILDSIEKVIPSVCRCYTLNEDAARNACQEIATYAHGLACILAAHPESFPASDVSEEIRRVSKFFYLGAQPK